MFQDEYMDAELAKVKLADNLYEVQSLFEQSTEELLDYETISQNLSAYGYQLYVLEDGNEVYSNFDSNTDRLRKSINKIDWSGEQTKVYSWTFVTAIGKSFHNNNHEYKLIAINRTKSLFEERETIFQGFIIDFILIGLATIFILIGISQLFTTRLVKRIMKPVNSLINASKRIEEGNLKESIVYRGYDEFETVCTSFNQMQQHLLEEQEQIASYEKARTDMVSGISHDLRTPLTSVKGYIKGLKDGVAATPEKQMQYLDIAYGKACEMDVLLQRLFYFSKMETGNMPFYKKVINFNEFINSFVDLCRNDLEAKGVTISYHSTIKSSMVSVDIEQIQRVFTNLIENSLRYANTNELKINFSLTQENDWDVIEISDNGNGVEADKLPHLFEQFYRGDESRSSKNSDGNGLGLYIAKYIVEAHNGTITAQNDNGLKIIIKLPIERMV
jgi:signal transduction histidine kinase